MTRKQEKLIYDFTQNILKFCDEIIKASAYLPLIKPLADRAIELRFNTITFCSDIRDREIQTQEDK